ncbi:iron complex transport system ATP-binding protein [Monaibacterium marinum]|uniref:Iron complex transport system ATP-binding protein n=1 Tax=Pontivivens marinum TaxID=1690039 RepID=A0A2C9CR13_9RHOB|nr:ABC transporter ATP-binding protein [Monaibacterium marinum]SOH93784.1 iron complex transport system ATP-binding protein [Monaibacterium marinum]
MTLEMRNISAGYGRHVVLRDITIPDIAAGDFVGVIGPNASGKSTMFKTLAGLLRPKGGSIHLDDTDLADLRRRDRARAVAYMPQAYGCNAILTVFESVLLALKQTTGWRVQDDNLDRVSETLAALRLSHLSERGISDLSGGQAQMVAVAQTMVRSPRVVLLDEPTSALDLHHQLSILGSVRDEMRRRGTIVMAALHDLNLAAQFCDRLVLINSGEILADGTPAEVLALPEIGKTYGVVTSLETTRRGSLFVDATLEARA